MGKLQPIDGKSSNWIGLWWHPEMNCFSSEAINLADLRKFKGVVRLYMRKNKFYNGGENGRPNYTFCLRDVDSEKPTVLEIEDHHGNTTYETSDGERLYTRKEVEEVKSGACMDGKSGYYPGDLLIEDYV